MNKKMIVFDLDGTLWSINSHADIIQKYYSWNAFQLLIHKAIGKCLPNFHLKYITNLFDKIPDSYVNDYHPKFRKDALKILNRARKEVYDILIISLAPQRILDNVSKRLGVPVLKSQPGKKGEILKQHYVNWGTLVVVTDNISDCDLVNMADKAIIYTSLRCVKKFQTKCNNLNIEFRDRRLE